MTIKYNDNEINKILNKFANLQKLFFFCFWPRAAIATTKCFFCKL